MCEVLVGLARHLSKVKKHCASPPSGTKTLGNTPRHPIIWRPGGRKEDPPRGRGEDCPNHLQFSPTCGNCGKLKNSKSQKSRFLRILKN